MLLLLLLFPGCCRHHSKRLHSRRFAKCRDRGRRLPDTPAEAERKEKTNLNRQKSSEPLRTRFNANSRASKLFFSSVRIFSAQTRSILAGVRRGRWTSLALPVDLILIFMVALCLVQVRRVFRRPKAAAGRTGAK